MGGKSGGIPLGLRAGAPRALWPQRAHCTPRGEGDEAVPGHAGRAGAARAIKQQRRRAGARSGCASAARPPACGGSPLLRLPPPLPRRAGAWAARRESSGSRGGGGGVVLCKEKRFSLHSGFPPRFRGRCGREGSGGGRAGLSVRRVVVVWVNSRPPSTCPGLGIKDGAPAGHVWCSGGARARRAAPQPPGPEQPLGPSSAVPRPGRPSVPPGRSLARPRQSGRSPLYWGGRR